jgi:hypothetical protein
MVDDPRLDRGPMVIFGKFFTFSLPLVWLVAGLGIIGLEFFFLCRVGVGEYV